MHPQVGWGDIILKNRQKVPHFLLPNNNTLILSGCELDLRGKAQYAMNYSGRVLGQQFSGDFLKEALRYASPDMPHRGPEYYQSGEYTYKCSVAGEISWFQGYEEIYWNTQKDYECYFHGGLLK